MYLDLLPVALINTTIKISLESGRVYLRFTSSEHPSTFEGSHGSNLEAEAATEAMEDPCLPVCPIASVQLPDKVPFRMMLPTVGWTRPHQSSIKTVQHSRG